MVFEHMVGEYIFLRVYFRMYTPLALNGVIVF